MGSKTRSFARSVVVLFVIGTLTAAQQIRGESVFSAAASTAASPQAAPSLALRASGVPAAGTSVFAYAKAQADTVETFDVQVEEEKESSLWKQLAVFGVIVGAVGYAVYALLGKDDAAPPESDGNSGKPTPTSVPGGAISIPLTR